MKLCSIDCFVNATLLASVICFAGCATVTRGTPSEIQQLHDIKIVRVTTPPLTRNTWSGSLVKLYPSLLTAVIDGQTEKLQGLQPPLIPDFGALVADRLNKTLAAKPWWQQARVVNEPIVSGASLPSGNTLLIELEKMVISGAGQFVTVSHFKLIENGDKVVWETRSSYNGLFSGKGDNIDARLLKGRAAVEEEFNDAADHLLQPLLERLP